MPSKGARALRPEANRCQFTQGTTQGIGVVVFLERAPKRPHKGPIPKETPLARPPLPPRRAICFTRCLTFWFSSPKMYVLRSFRTHFSCLLMCSPSRTCFCFFNKRFTSGFLVWPAPAKGERLSAKLGVGFGQIGPSSDRVLPTSCRSGPNLVRVPPLLCRNRPLFGQLRPIWTDSGQHWTGFGRSSAEFGQIRADFDQFD